MVLKNFCKHYALRSDKELALKVVKLFKNDFLLSVIISEIIVILTFQLIPSILLQVFLVEPDNYNENLDCMGYKFLLVLK